VDWFYEQGKFARGLTLDLEGKWIGASHQMPLNEFLSQFFQANLSKIWDCLMDQALQQKLLKVMLALIYSDHCQQQLANSVRGMSLQAGC